MSGRLHGTFPAPTRPHQDADRRVGPDKSGGVRAAALALLEQHVHGGAGAPRCRTCAAGMARAGEGAEAFHALCPEGKAIVAQVMPPETRAFARAADAALAKLDAQAVSR